MIGLIANSGFRFSWQRDVLVLVPHEADPSGSVGGVLLFVGEYVEFTLFTVRIVVGGNRLTSVVHATDFSVELNDSGDQLYFQPQDVVPDVTRHDLVSGERLDNYISIIRITTTL